MVRTMLLLVCITFLGALLRFFNLSPFTIYPDSFQNLIVAENIKHYMSVVGYMGKNGMFYPDFFMWTRPLFPLLIDAVSYFGISPLSAGRSIAFILGILAIPLAFLFGKAVFKRTSIGLSIAFLLALSYNHAVWSGMLMTEAAGIFFMILFLWRFFTTVTLEIKWFNFQSIMTGLLFALAILTRYEYIILAIPGIFFAWNRSPQPLRYLLQLFGATAVVIIIALFLLFPIDQLLVVIASQFSDLLTKTAVVIGTLTLGFITYHFLPRSYKNRIQIRIPFFLSILLAISYILIVPELLGNAPLFVFGIELTFIKNFIKHDFLLSLLAVFGFLKMFKISKYNAEAYFSLCSIILLVFIYHQINPDMERYLTHVIPFLLIPASVGLVVFFQKVFLQANFIRFILIACSIVVVIMQTVMTGDGLSYLNDSSWYRSSYEEKAAILTGQHITDHPILEASFPEPYYYFLGDDTQSISDEFPYFYFPKLSDNQTIVIIEDMGMRDVFPHFTAFIHSSFKQYKYASFFVKEKYHYGDKSIKENSPIILYKIRWSQLQKILKI